MANILEQMCRPVFSHVKIFEEIKNLKILKFAINECTEECNRNRKNDNPREMRKMFLKKNKGCEKKLPKIVLQVDLDEKFTMNLIITFELYFRESKCWITIITF